MWNINEMLNGYTIGLLTMVLWGIAPVFGKIGLNQLEPLPALFIRSAMVTTILAAFIIIKGRWPEIANASGYDVMFIMLEGLCAALFGQLAYYYAIKIGDISRVSLIDAGAPLITLLLAVIVLSEKITFYKLAGAAAILFGIVLLRI